MTYWITAFLCGRTGNWLLAGLDGATDWPVAMTACEDGSTTVGQWMTTGTFTHTSTGTCRQIVRGTQTGFIPQTCRDTVTGHWIVRVSQTCRQILTGTRRTH